MHDMYENLVYMWGSDMQKLANVSENLNVFNHLIFQMFAKVQQKNINTYHKMATPGETKLNIRNST